jgi:hypothetical protein
MKTRQWIVGALFGGVVCLCLFIAWGYWVNATKVLEWSKFGDAFAPLTGFVTAVALLLSAASVALQRTDIEIQQRDLKATIETMKEQATHQRVQVEIQSKLLEQDRRSYSLARRAHMLAEIDLRMRLDEFSMKSGTYSRDRAPDKVKEELARMPPLPVDPDARNDA